MADFKEVATEVVGLVLGAPSSSLAAFDNIVEDHLQRIDEISAIVDSVRSRGTRALLGLLAHPWGVSPPPQLRLEIQHTSDAAFPILLQNCQELESLFRVIDQAEVAVEHTAAAAAAAEERLAVLQGAFATRFPEGLSRITSLFGKARVTDAPARLAAFDASTARVNVFGEMAALREALGEATSMLDAFAEAEGGEEGSGEEEGAAAPAQPLQAATPSGSRRIAAGEDDEDEDDD
jgi:hypothetical protein